MSGSSGAPSSGAGHAQAPQAPGELELVRRFVNSLDIEAGLDRLSDVEAWTEWAASIGIVATGEAGRVVGDSDLAFARLLREALRDGLLANHDRADLPETTAAALTDAARLSRLELVFDASGPRLTGRSLGIAGVISRVVATVADAMADGTWIRLKACRNDTCRWGFYDHSRSRTGQWCSMAVCGNRAKQARWRGQHRS